MSGYAGLSAASNASARHGAEISSCWKRTLTIPTYKVPAHCALFMNDLLASMAENFSIQHKPSVAYLRWDHEMVDLLNVDIRTTSRSMLTESKLAPRDCTSLIDILPSILNESSARQLGKFPDSSTRASMQVMTCLRPRHSMLQFVPGWMMGGDAPNSIGRTAAEHVRKLKLLQTSSHKLHNDVAEPIAARPERAIKLQDAASSIVGLQFVVEYFVFVCKATRPKHKLLFC